jgi:hypothetical protein
LNKLQWLRKRVDFLAVYREYDTRIFCIHISSFWFSFIFWEISMIYNFSVAGDRGMWLGVWAYTSNSFLCRAVTSTLESLISPDSVRFRLSK